MKLALFYESQMMCKYLQLNELSISLSLFPFWKSINIVKEGFKSKDWEWFMELKILDE